MTESLARHLLITLLYLVCVDVATTCIWRREDEFWVLILSPTKWVLEMDLRLMGVAVSGSFHLPSHLTYLPFNF